MTQPAAPTITVTKFDAMRRQLLTAVKLWFDDGDPVAIHTLLFASHEILHTQYRRRGFRHLLFDSPSIKDEYRKEWSRHITQSATFFEHSRADPDGTIDFNVGLNEMYLLFSIYGLNQMGEKPAGEELAFMHWLLVKKPEIFKEGAHDRFSVDQLEELRSLDKKEFLRRAVLRYQQNGKI